MVTPAVQREAVAHLQACHGMSERRACRVTGADRKSMRYRSQRGDDADVREKLRELAQQRRRFGYRRLHILLRREGVLINRKKIGRASCRARVCQYVSITVGAGSLKKKKKKTTNRKEKK